MVPRGTNTALLLAVLALQAAVQAVPLPDPAAAPQGGAPPPPAPPPPPCGSCYGAEDPAKGRRCCESCSDVRNAYKEKGWAWPGERTPSAGSADGVRVTPRMCSASRTRVPAASPPSALALWQATKTSSSARTSPNPPRRLRRPVRVVLAAVSAVVCPGARENVCSAAGGGGVRNPDIPCGNHLSCDACRANGCAWCIAARRCVDDKPWMCTGEDDHIGNAGTVKSCPTRSEVNIKRKMRRDEEEKARAERRQMTEEEQELCRKRAQDKLSAKQEEELQRLRGEDTGTDSAAGGAAAANEAEIRRRAAAAPQAESDPYGVLELDSEAQMTAIRKAYRRLSLQVHVCVCVRARVRGVCV